MRGGVTGEGDEVNLARINRGLSSLLLVLNPQLFIKHGYRRSHLISEVDSRLHAFEDSEDVDIGTVDVLEDDGCTHIGFHQFLYSSSDRGIRMVFFGLATLRMSRSSMCSILMLSVLGAWDRTSRLTILFWAILGRENAWRRRVVSVSS